MTTMLDEFDLDVRLGEPLRIGVTGIRPQTEGNCTDSGYATCGDYCPTKPAKCPSRVPNC